MYCNKCGIEAENSDVCPLCHTPLTEEAASRLPSKKKKARVKIISFTKWYIIASAAIFALCLGFNLAIPPTMLWSVFVAVELMHIYYTIRITILNSYKRLILRIIGQEIMLSITLITAGAIFEISQIIYLYVLPTINLAILLFILIYVAIKRNDRQMGSFGLFVLGMFSFLPLCITLIMGSYYIPSIIMAGLTNAATAGFLIFGGKEVLNTFKLMFHL